MDHTGRVTLNGYPNIISWVVQQIIFRCLEDIILIKKVLPEYSFPVCAMRLQGCLVQKRWYLHELMLQYAQF